MTTSYMLDRTGNTFQRSLTAALTQADIDQRVRQEFGSVLADCVGAPDGEWASREGTRNAIEAVVQSRKLFDDLVLDVFAVILERMVDSESEVVDNAIRRHTTARQMTGAQ